MYHIKTESFEISLNATENGKLTLSYKYLSTDDNKLEVEITTDNYDTLREQTTLLNHLTGVIEAADTHGLTNKQAIIWIDKLAEIISEKS